MPKRKIDSPVDLNAFDELKDVAMEERETLIDVIKQEIN